MHKHPEQDLKQNERDAISIINKSLLQLFCVEKDGILIAGKEIIVNNENALSKREKEVCREIKKSGFKPELNAGNLCIAESSLKKHVEHIYDKKNIHSAADLIKYIYDHPDEIEVLELKIRYMTY